MRIRFQAHAARAEVPAHPARPGDPRYPPQDCRGRPDLRARFNSLLDLATKVSIQDHRQRGPKIYSLHAPEVECIGKRKGPRTLRVRLQSDKRRNAGVHVTEGAASSCCMPSSAARQLLSMATPLDSMVADLEKLHRRPGAPLCIHVDKGYRGHNANKLRVFRISGQVRRTTASLRREMKRRAAVEPVIGHIKAEHRMDRNYLKGREGGPHQRRPRRRRLQLLPADPLARRAFACPHRDPRLRRPRTEKRLNQRPPKFFTGD